MAAWKTASGFLARPAVELLAGLDRVLGGGALRLGVVFLGLAAGWWVYVPLHELLHAAGCVLAGGTVTRLEVAPWYGGTLLAHAFPFVVAGGEYAGRLSGLDTRGSDAVYLATDLAPFVLALWPGLWAWRRAARRGAAFAFGAFLPVALAPFLSLSGDAYEIGSILVTRLPPWHAAAAVLRSDDVFRCAQALAASGDGAPWGGLAAGQAAGLAWCYLMYAFAGLVARRLGQPPLAPASAPEGPS